MRALEQLQLACSLCLRSIACCACSRIVLVIGVQSCAFDADAAVKKSRVGASGKLEPAITGDFVGLHSSVYSRSGCALMTGCKAMHAYSRTQLQRHMLCCTY